MFFPPKVLIFKRCIINWCDPPDVSLWWLMEPLMEPIHPTQGGRSLSQQPYGEREGTLWEGRHSTESAVNPTKCMSLYYCLKLKYPERIHADTERTCQLCSIEGFCLIFSHVECLWGRLLYKALLRFQDFSKLMFLFYRSWFTRLVICSQSCSLIFNHFSGVCSFQFSCLKMFDFSFSQCQR